MIEAQQLEHDDQLLKCQAEIKSLEMKVKELEKEKDEVSKRNNELIEATNVASQNDVASIIAEIEEDFSSSLPAKTKPKTKRNQATYKPKRKKRTINIDPEDSEEFWNRFKSQK